MNRAKVMIVDDSELILAMTKDALETAGFDVVTRDSPIGTSAAVKAEKPHCLMVDISMPALSGTELVKLIGKRKDDNLKIILHSSKEEEELKRLTEECGADGYIKKNNDMSALAEGVRSILSC